MANLSLGSVMDLSSSKDDEKSDGVGIGQKLSQRRAKDKLRAVSMLQEELRNEESKLVLLKKIKQSQMLQHVTDSPTSGTTQNNSAGAVNKMMQGRQQNQPPPLVRGNGQIQHGKMVSHHIQRGSGSSNSQSSSNNRGSGNNATQQNGPPPLMMSQNSQQQHMRGMHGSSSSPNLQNFR